MESPAFSLSLDDFPGLLDVPLPSESFLGEKVINALQEGLKHYPPSVAGHIYLPWFNEMRHHFWQLGDERSSMAFADLSLAYSPFSERAANYYTLSVLSDWKTEPEEAVRALLDKAARFKDLPSLYAACLKRASELCASAGAKDVARPLFLAWQNLPNPLYPELLPLVGQINVENYASTIPERQYQTSAPEPVEGAHNGWRDGRWNPLSPQQEEEVRSLIAKHDLQEIEEQIISLSQNAIGFTHLGRLPHRVGASRLGGVPDVPDGWVWPENMEFLAQFNLEEIAPFDFNHVLPSHGMLRFFAQNSLWDFSVCRVEWDESDTNQLQPAPYPSNYDVVGVDDCAGEQPFVYSSVPVSLFCFPSLPDQSLYRRYQENADVYELKHEASPKIRHDGAHQLLGRFDQGQEEIWTAENGQHYSRLPKEEKAKAIEEVEKWVLLFQIDSWNEAGISFNDAGTGFFFIHRDDLMARRFDRIRVTMICG